MEDNNNIDVFEKGIYIGKVNTDEPVILLNRRALNKNSSRFILGTLGEGKSFRVVVENF